MKKTLTAAVIFALLALNTATVKAQGGETIERSVVKIFVVSNQPDYQQPWQMLGQKSFTGSGCIIDGKRILTNAHVIENETFIQVLKYGDTKRYTAKVIAVDNDCDLAVLGVEDNDFFKDTMPLSFGKLPELGDEVRVLGYPQGGEKLSITKGVVSRIEVGKYAHSFRNLLDIQIDAAINPGNSGGPVISGGKIIGVAFQGITESQNIGYAIPVVIIGHFLKEVANPKYGGFPMLGVIYQKLENDSYRSILGMGPDESGVIVDRVYYDSSAWGFLKEGDVILSIDGVKVGNDNTIPFKNKSRVDFSYLISSKFAGDVVNLGVLRDKKVIAVSFPLKNSQPLVPFREYDVKPEYYIFGGVVFTKLTGNYLFKLDENYFNQASTLYDRYFHDIPTQARQEIVIVQQVLTDELNIGYDGCSIMIVDTINGEPVADMKDLIKKIENNRQDSLIIGLDYNYKIALDYKKCIAATPDILRKYNIPFDRSENFRAH
jgi:S1-C subfamily serine protease